MALISFESRIRNKNINFQVQETFCTFSHLLTIVKLGWIFRVKYIFNPYKKHLNCLPLLSFKSKIRRKEKKLSLGGILHISAKLQGIFVKHHVH